MKKNKKDSAPTRGTKGTKSPLDPRVLKGALLPLSPVNPQVVEEGFKGNLWFPCHRGGIFFVFLQEEGSKGNLGFPL